MIMFYVSRVFFIPVLVCYMLLFSSCSRTVDILTENALDKENHELAHLVSNLEDNAVLKNLPEQDMARASIIQELESQSVSSPTYAAPASPTTYSFIDIRNAAYAAQTAAEAAKIAADETKRVVNELRKELKKHISQ